MLPRSNEQTTSPWQTYQDVEQAFDAITPGETTTDDLKLLRLDPTTNQNIVILNYSDVLRKFLLNQSISLNDLDDGIRDCVRARILCRGYEVNQKNVRKHRNGSFWLDLFGFKRETHIAGWRFSGLILVREDVVVYKLTGGQPSIQESEQAQNPLGPVQALSQRFLGVGQF